MIRNRKKPERFSENSEYYPTCFGGTPYANNKYTTGRKLINGTDIQKKITNKDYCILYFLKLFIIIFYLGMTYYLYYGC